MRFIKKRRRSWGLMLLVVALVMLAWVATLSVQGATITSTGPPELAGSGVKLTNGLTWTQVSETGFGDANNVEVKSMAVSKGYLYTGNKNSITGTEIWRTTDGLTWEQANTDGFGDANNMNVFALVPFGDHLYAATDNSTMGGGTGGEVWRTADGTSWEQVNTDGFGDANNIVAWTMAVFTDTLYVGTANYANGAEIWRSTDGTTWEQANTDGFGDANNVRALSMAAFDGYLYVGTTNSATGSEIWRTADGTTWTQVNSDGFGSAANDGTYTLAPFGGYLYAGTRNRSTGGQLWRTADGTTWESVITDGFGDTDNDTINVLVALGDDFYAGTARADGATTGAEIWRSSDGTSWTQVNTDGFGVASNEQINCLAAFGNHYYAGVRNETIGGQVWRTETNTLEIFSYWVAPGEQEALNALVGLYTSNYPGVDVVIFSNRSEILDRIIAGDPPDSLQTHGGEELFDTWVEPGYVEPITQLWHDEGWLDKFPQGLIDMLSYRGEIYCVPLAVHRSNVLWYNKQVFDDNDLTPPTTFDEFFDVAASLQSFGVTPLALGSQDTWTATHLFEDVLLGVLGPDDYRHLWTGQLSFTDVRVKQALETYKQVLNYVNDDHEALNLWQAIQLVLSGDAAMVIMGDWMDGLFKALGWVPDIDFGWVPSPESAGSFMVINDCFALPDNAPHLDNAINWLKTVGSVEGQDAFNPLKGSIPARTDANPSLYDVYQQSAMADYAEDEHAPSLVHGAAAPPSFITACDDIIDNFIADGDTEAAANALQQAALDAGFGRRFVFLPLILKNVQ